MTPAEFYVSSDAWYTCKSLLNTLARAVEQLSWLDASPSKQKLAVEVKVQQTATPARRVKMYYEYLMR